jgi:hypothetical protein
MDFETWMAKVDAWLWKNASLDSWTLPDWGYRNAYDDGVSPAKAAKEALKAAGGF